MGSTIQRRPLPPSSSAPYSSPTTASSGRSEARRRRSACSTSRSASVTGVRSGLVSTTRSASRKRATVMASAASVSSRARSRSLCGAATGRMLRPLGCPLMPAHRLQEETVEVLQRLVRFNTVNPPGRERPAIEYLDDYLSQAGFETEQLAADEERPNLVADLAGERDGPTLCLLSHVDTVIADASEWTHDPWSGDVADGYVWGRGSIDMKSQAAAEAVAAASLARAGWRPARGA